MRVEINNFTVSFDVFTRFVSNRPNNIKNSFIYVFAADFSVELVSSFLGEAYIIYGL